MAMSFFRRNWRRSIRMMLLPIFAAIILIQWIGDARSEAGMPVLNSSGNLNRELSVDPIGTKEGYSVYLYNAGNGLPTSEANDIAQDSIGIIWIGSYAGLIRYDGNSFERYDPDSGITSVRCLYTDSLDRLWIGSNDNGAFLLSKGEIHHWDKSSGFRSLSIRDIAEGEDGRIYIASTMGVGIIDASLAFTPLEDERISEQTVPQIRRGSDGLIYGLTQTGDLFALKNGKMSAFLKSADFPSEEPLEIFPDPEQPGYLYVGTEHYVCHGSLETGFDSREAREIAPLVSVECIESFGGRLWICARNGVGRLEDDGVHVIENIPMSNSLNHILSDFDGNLWITSSRHGVMKIVSNRFTDVFEQYGLPASVVNSTCMLDGRLFVGTENGLIVLEDGKKLNSLPVTEIVTASGKPVDVSDLVDYLDGIRVRTICRDSRNRLWISTARECGLLRYDHGKILQFTVEDGILDEAVRVVSECTDGSMLVATNNGVNVIEGDRVVQGYGQEDGMDVRMILTVTEGFSNEVIAGSDGGGIYIICPEGIRKIGIEDGLTSEIIMRIKRSRIRDLYWIITGNSLACMTPDYQVKTVRAFPTANNIDLYENSRGDLWLLGTHGINVILSEDIMADEPGEPIYLETADGLPYVVTSNSYSEVTENGDLFMSGNEGIVKVNIDQSLSYNGEIRISMPYIEADDSLIFPEADGSFYVPGYVQKLTIYPYVLNYSLFNPLVEYRLEGFEKEDVSVSRDELVPVYYTNLAKGTYTFVMRVKNPITHTDNVESFQIIKGKPSSVGNDGSIILDVTSLFFMGGLLIYTALYRKRGRLDDKLFLAMIVSNMFVAVTDMVNYLADGSGYGNAEPVLIVGNLLFYAAFEIFPYLYILFLDYRLYQDIARIRKIKLWYAIPCILILILLSTSLLTGWIFSVNSDGLYQSGPWNNLVFVPVAFYFLCALIRLGKINTRLVFLGILLIITRILLGAWFRDISSTAMIYTLFLVCTHIHVMNSPLNEEMP